jgi:hypothetical protein
MTFVRRLVIAAVVALAAPGSALAAGTGMAPLRPERLLEPSRAFRDTILRHAPARTPQARDDAEATYTTNDGMTVHVVFTGLSAPDAVAGQSTADFLDSLLHGAELSTLTVDLAPFVSIQRTCGIQALACYFPSRRTLYIPTALPVAVDVPLEQILAHEYGHHVAASRSNPPWAAVDWGPKRWATYMGVCPHTFAGEMFPGDEGAAYELNPGEGWAEAFRLTNSLRIGTWRDIGWPVVDDVFRPNETALGIVDQDVLQPWSAPPPLQLKGLVRKGQVRRIRIATPLDGLAAASVAGPAGLRLAFDTGRSKRQSANGRTATATVCGARTTALTLRARSAGRFVLTYSVE